MKLCLTSFPLKKSSDFLQEISLLINHFVCFYPRVADATVESANDPASVVSDPDAVCPEEASYEGDPESVNTGGVG